MSIDDWEYIDIISSIRRELEGYLKDELYISNPEGAFTYLLNDYHHDVRKRLSIIVKNGIVSYKDEIRDNEYKELEQDFEYLKLNKDL